MGGLSMSRIGLLAGTALLTIALTGCRAETRQRLLSMVFDGVTPTPPPPTRRLRRDLLRENQQLQEQLEQARAELTIAQERGAPQPDAPAAALRPIEQSHRWDEAAQLLPKTEEMPDWSKALAEGIVAPKPGSDPQAARQPVIPLDIELIPESDPTYKVVFGHAAHTAWLSCANCHPGIFPMKQGGSAITMETIGRGEHCGVCHGPVAFSADACARCHAALGGTP